MNKVKSWIKNHKKEILVGLAAAGGTALYFIAKKKMGMKAILSLRLGFLDGDDEFGRFGWSNEISTNYCMDNPDLTISDLGNFGNMIKERIPSIDESTKISNFNVNYRKLKGKGRAI